MSRKVTFCLSLLILGAFVAAIVRAQENGGREERSVLVRRSAAEMGPSTSSRRVAPKAFQRPSEPQRLEPVGSTPIGERKLAPIVSASDVADERQAMRQKRSAPPVEVEYTRPRSSRRRLETPAQAPISPAYTEQRRPAFTEQRTPSNDVLVQSTGPALSVETIGPDAVVVGKESEYRIRAINLGSSAAREVYIRIEIPESVEVVAHDPTSGGSQIIDGVQGARRVDWKIDELAGRAQEQLALRLIPKDPRAFNLRVEWVTRPNAATAQIQVQQPQMELTVVGPRAILYGDTEVYTITISNPGTGTSEDVVLEVTPGNNGAESKRIGSIPAGGREIVKLELTAGEAGQMPIRAVARADGGLEKEVVHDVLVRRAKLDVRMLGPTIKYAGSVGAYQVRVVNTGDAPAEDVTGFVQLPSGAKYLAGLSNVQQLKDGLQWRIGTLQPGDERLFKIQCELTLSGENRFQASVNSDGGVESTGAFTTRVEAVADLKLMVNDPQGPQPLGREVEYEIVLLNRGSKSAQNIKVIGHFAEGIEPSSVEGAPAELGPGQVIFSPIARIGAGNKVILKVKAIADRGGDLRFRAEVECNDPKTRLIAEETTHYFGEGPAATSDAQPE